MNTSFYGNKETFFNTIKRAVFAFTSVLFILCLNIGFSQDNPNDSDNHLPGWKNGSNIDVSIKYYNKQLYFVESPIIVEFQIVNNGISPYLFITSYNKMFTFDFEIVTPSNRNIHHSKEYTIRTTQFEPVFNDEITLKYNEVYGVRIDISRWFHLSEPGEYIIRGVFYPNLNTGSDEDMRIYSKNELYLSLNPPYKEEVQKRIEIEKIKKLKAESLPPYEVVRFMLEALQKEDYEKYFLYIKFDKYIMLFSNARQRYIDAKDINKPAVIEELKQYLMGKNKLEDIPYSETIPADFDINKTVIEKHNAVVTVTETFKYLNLIENKRYTYHLHLYGDKWLLESYSVVNISR